MECSIIIAVLDSHEIVRRQLLYFNTLIPRGVEVILVDDGSDPPLVCEHEVYYSLKILYTNDRRPWTQDNARNIGASVATGKYLLMNDIDHILTVDVLASVLSFKGDMLIFHRRAAELDESGGIVNVGKQLSPSPNNYSMRSDLYRFMGGYETDGIIYGTDRMFRNRYLKLVQQGLAKPVEIAGELYVIEGGPWFHSLPRKLIEGLLGDWEQFDSAEWKEAGNHKFLNRDSNLHIHWNRLHKYVPEYLVSSTRCRLLDVGCGNGASMEVFRYFGHGVHGMDFTPGMSDEDPDDWIYKPLIRSQKLQCTVHNGSVLPYPFTDKSFDVLICWGALSCFKPVSIWTQILNEFARIATQCILFCDNLGPIHDAGRSQIEQWNHSDFNLVMQEGDVFKWCAKAPAQEQRRSEPAMQT